LQLFRHQAAGLFLVPFPPFPAIEKKGVSP
jgi:hypothetical protein